MTSLPFSASGSSSSPSLQPSSFTSSGGTTKVHLKSSFPSTFLDHGLTAEEVRKGQKDLLLHLDQWYLPELIDIKPARGGSYIHASTEAYNEEGEEEEQVIKNWVDYFGFSYHQIHASGHAPMDKVGHLVGGVNAKAVIPVHTERPDLFSAFPKRGKVLAPKIGVDVPVR